MPYDNEKRQALYASLGKKLRQARKKCGWTLAEVSMISGIDSGNISKIERGLIQTSFVTVVLLANAVGLRVEFKEDPAAMAVGLRP